MKNQDSRVEVYYSNDLVTEDPGWYYSIRSLGVQDIGPYNSSEIAWQEALLELEES